MRFVWKACRIVGVFVVVENDCVQLRIPQVEVGPERGIIIVPPPRPKAKNRGWGHEGSGIGLVLRKLDGVGGTKSGANTRGEVRRRDIYRRYRSIGVCVFGKGNGADRHVFHRAFLRALGKENFTLVSGRNWQSLNKQPVRMTLGLSLRPI